MLVIKIESAGGSVSKVVALEAPPLDVQAQGISQAKDEGSDIGQDDDPHPPSQPADESKSWSAALINAGFAPGNPPCKQACSKQREHLMAGDLADL